MKFENMDLEQIIDNEIDIGEHISLDDIIDNVSTGNHSKEPQLVLNEAQVKKVVHGMISDPTITDDYWEEKVQHIRDDFLFHLSEYGCVDVEELAYFHGHCVYEMVKKYL